MIRRIILFVTSFLVHICFAANLNETCITPNKEKGICVPGLTCKVIADALLTKNKGAIAFAMKSQCGYYNEPLFCCGSYGYFTFDNEWQLNDAPIPNTPTTELPDKTVCGLEKDTDRIHGGSITGLGEFPWMVALEFENRFTAENEGLKCGGTLINNVYVLSAAHCLIHVEFKAIRAWLGDWNIETDPDCEPFVSIPVCADPVRKVDIAHTVIHQNYSNRHRDNDIALIRLKEFVEYTDYIRPICIHVAEEPSLRDGMGLTAVGWGLTETETVSNLKLKVVVPLMSNDVCIEKLKPSKMSKNQLCAGGELGKDSCQGDSGGPLMRFYESKFYKPLQWYLEGVIAWGLGCGRKDYPAVYTRVFTYVDWIHEVLRAENGTHPTSS